MLPKNYRLKNKSAFSATYRLKNIVSDNFFILYYGKIKPDKEVQTKIGFVVSKKIHKRSVRRNRIKRLLREVIRLKIKNNETEKVNNYLSLIFIAREKSLTADFKTVQNSVTGLLERI